MEIKVNDYVRFKNGKICKVNMVDERNNPLFDLNINGGLYSTHDILKTSPQIIDLIEVGDYVNSCKVYQNTKDKLIIGGINGFYDVHENGITSIVTKEMFEKMEYKIN